MVGVRRLSRDVSGKLREREVTGYDFPDVRWLWLGRCGVHTWFSLVSVKQSLQWKLPSVLRAPSTFPSPADAQNFPGWMWDAESRTIPEFSEMVPAEDLGESQQTESG